MQASPKRRFLVANVIERFRGTGGVRLEDVWSSGAHTMPARSYLHMRSVHMRSVHMHSVHMHSVHELILRLEL